MSNYVNQIIDPKTGSEHDINDARIVATAEDVGKLLSVDETGQLIFVDPPAGGTKLYKHSIREFDGGPSYPLISTDSTPYSTYDDLRRAAEGGTIVMYPTIGYQDGGYTVFFIYFTTGAADTVHLSTIKRSDGEFRMFDHSSADTITDTVTPL